VSSCLICRSSGYSKAYLKSRDHTEPLGVVSS
jgi:hypothetical protein